MVPTVLWAIVLPRNPAFVRWGRVGPDKSICQAIVVCEMNTTPHGFHLLRPTHLRPHSLTRLRLQQSLRCVFRRALHSNMTLFRQFRPRVIVPLNSTVAEPYVLRCLYIALHAVPTSSTGTMLSSSPYGSPEHLTFALRSVCAARQCQPYLHSGTSSQTRTLDHSSSDTLLDHLVPVLSTKCDLDTLETALSRCETSHADHVAACGTDEAQGEDRFSLCTMLAATRAARMQLDV